MLKIILINILLLASVGYGTELQIKISKTKDCFKFEGVNRSLLKTIESEACSIKKRSDVIKIETGTVRVKRSYDQKKRIKKYEHKKFEGNYQEIVIITFQYKDFKKRIPEVIEINTRGTVSFAEGRQQKEMKSEKIILVE